MKLSYNQKETLVAILNQHEEEVDYEIKVLVDNYLAHKLYNAGTLKSLARLGLIEYEHKGVSATGIDLYRMEITKKGEEVAFKELGFDA